MNLQAILTANGISAALLVVLLIVSRNAPRTHSPREKMFSAMVWATLSQSVAEGLAFFWDGASFAGASVVLRLLNSWLFAVCPLISWVWICYVDHTIYHSDERLKTVGARRFIPAGLMMAGALANLFVPIFYRVNAQNAYSRTALTPLPFCVTYGYMLYSLVLAGRAQSRQQSSHYVFRSVLLFLIPIFVGSLLQLLFYGQSLIWVSLAVGLVALYGTLQNAAIYIDPLSQLYNRQFLNRNLQRLVKEHRRGRTAGIMVDIDDFKSINDRFGHLVGDQAIVDTADILRAATGPDDVVARYAGDEFVILTQAENEAALQKKAQCLMQQARDFDPDSRRPYRIRFSLGCELMQNETPEAFLDKIDAAMYLQKRQSKQRAAPQTKAGA